MNVMNIKHYLSGVAALAMLAACSDYDPGMSENAVDLTDAEIETIQEYTANFVERYGEMDPNHTWGFGELAELEKMGTRAVLVNHNQWFVYHNVWNEETQQRETGWDVNTSYLPVDAKIPGMPSVVDGKYYTEQGIFDNFDALINSGKTSVNPIGDVTDEEIVYVSNWFRSNDQIQSDVPQFTEFFIQDVSQDKDRKSYPDGEWIDCDLPVHLPEGGFDNGTDHITFGMDYFYVNTSENKTEHTNNYNKERANWIPESNPSSYEQTFPHRTIQYWKTEGGYTTDFVFHNSDNNTDYDNFVLKHLVFDIPQSDGTNHHYDGYYLAFDYEYEKITSEGKWSKVEPDGRYSNWIVKLSPADPKWNDPEEQHVSIKRRVMCEDLGSTFDFDFNDLVFDVEYTREEKKVNGEWVPKNPDGLWDATITLQAVGGTLPIYIKNFNGTVYNAHELMGGTLSESGIYSPVNVGTGDTHAPVKLPTVRVASTNPDNIVISVTSPDKVGRDATNTLELPKAEGSKNFGTNFAPQKICVPVTTRWTKEYQQIETAYPYFHEWVNRENGDFGFDNPNDWTKKDINTSKLF